MHVGKFVACKNDGIQQVVAGQIYVVGELRGREKLQVGKVASDKSRKWEMLQVAKLASV